MCGIAGFFSVKNVVSEPELRLMTRTSSHRGPNALPTSGPENYMESPVANNYSHHHLGTLTGFTAEVLSATDYYPGVYPDFFGSSPMPGRSFEGEYRFGFNGQEKDDEISGTTGANYTATFWEYDARVGRRWNLDPKPVIGISEYACFGNNPIWYSDPLGD